MFVFCISAPHTLLPAETSLRSNLFPFLPWHTAGTQVWLCDQVTCDPSHSLSSSSTHYLQRSQKRTPLSDGHGTGQMKPGARVHLGTPAMNASMLETQLLCCAIQMPKSLTRAVFDPNTLEDAQLTPTKSTRKKENTCAPRHCEMSRPSDPVNSTSRTICEENWYAPVKVYSVRVGSVTENSDKEWETT